jgi:DNA-binding transcriptional LysR family regulator
MELHQLEAFAAVMSAGSVTGAGKLTGRSQPAVTRLIQELEAEIGYALFDRRGPRVTPTPRAFRLYEEVERSLIGLERIRASALAIGRDDAPPLTVAATPALAASLVPRALAGLSDAHAGAVQLRSASAEQVVQALLARAADAGIATLPLDHAALDLHYLIEAPCVVVMRRDDPLAALPVVPLEALRGRRLATVSNRYRLRRRIDDAFGQAGFAPHVALESNASLNAVMAAHAGLAIALVDPATAFGTPVSDVVTRSLDVHIPFYFGVVTAADRRRSDAIDALIDAILQAALHLLPGAIRHDATRHAALLTPMAAPRPSSAKRITA